ncbi:MAG: hypothetical protein R3199_07295 [Gemmatimonadota bacterium]|nr:hypothetical protein [Gemmatimonadota bacterium]
MTPFWKKDTGEPSRHAEPDEAVAGYLDRLHEADASGNEPPAGVLNGLGDAYLDKGDIASAVDYWRQAAEAYAREGMHDNAIACCKKIRRNAPAEGNTALLIGRYYAAKGLEADAERELAGYAERKRRMGDRDEAILALEEIVAMGSDRPERREELAGLLLEKGLEEVAVEELRAAASTYRANGDEEAARRVRQRLQDLGASPAGLAEPEPAASTPSEPPPEPEPAASTPSEPPPEPEPEEEAGLAPREEDFLGGLEIEPTSYTDPKAPAGDEPEEEPTVAREGERDPGTIVPSGLEEAASELERASLPAEMMDLAEARIREGSHESGARMLLEAADAFREEERWAEAIAAYVELAKIGHARGEDFEDWVECARETGRPEAVLEALATAGRWHLRNGDKEAARRIAGEMLQVDPESETASEILARAGTALPPQ